MPKVGPSIVGTRGRIKTAREWVLTEMRFHPERAWTLEELVPRVRRAYGATAKETEAALRQLVTMRKIDVVVRGRGGHSGAWRVAS
jgi:hypothetical protein